MKFRKFQEFLEDRGYFESNANLNRTAMTFEKKLAQFNSRFSDPAEAERIIKSAGYNSVSQFVSDPSDAKWSKLKMPGQENYVR